MANSDLKELAQLFLKLGATAFGGPAAHIALMNQEIVERRKWLDRQRFLDLLGATNLIPGPNSTELAIHIGLERAGWRGLIVAGGCFILPAMLIVWALAALYARYQTVPQLGWLMYGVKPVIIAIVVQALWSLGKTAFKNAPTALVSWAAFALSLAGLNEILLLLLSGLVTMLALNWGRGLKSGGAASFFIPAPGLLSLAQAPGFVGIAAMAGVAGASAPPSLAGIFWFFLKIGSVLYGSGYVLLAFLQNDLVERWGWLTSQQLIDAVAIGQFTPGPLFTTATFIGYLLGGSPGAILGTVGIFLPAFFFVAAVNPLIPVLRLSPWAGGFLDGVNAASLGLMGAVTLDLGRAALTDGLTVILAFAALWGVFRYKFNSTWLVLAGGLIGLIWRTLI